MSKPDPPSLISPEEIRQLLHDDLGLEVDTIVPIRSGAWSSAVGITTRHGDYVMRFSRTDEDFRRDQFVARFAGLNLPIPRVLGIGQIDSNWWCLSERVPGIHLDDLNAADLAATIPSLADMLIAMRSVDASGTLGYGGLDAAGNGRFESFGDQLLEIAKDVLERREDSRYDTLQQHPQALATLERGVETLQHQVQFLSSSRQLIHMDTLNYNLNVQNNRVSGVYDWGCAMWGDAVYDLAWFAFWEPWYPQWQGVHLAESIIDLVGIQGDHADERLACCKLHIGLDHIRYNAFTRNIGSLERVAEATERLLDEIG
ncbi:MAG: aminoglycoside phosphotransferase family protein [Thermomicrobiales bacterium]|nr:aminoglycoside phosphotransferase family protein [Thermomicrobiales bacterium]